jgi:hypothetical protein
MNIYQIQIILTRSEPLIWRRLLIPSNLLLPDLHLIIQVSMGWENDHLYQFIKGKNFYSPEDYTGDVEYEEIKISDLLKKEKEKIVYEYDFGDSWEHDVILEKILSDDKKLKSSVCLEGKMACPPEDCGGVWGYSDMLEILKHQDHEDYENIMEWLGGEFDPEYFDKESVNRVLKRFKISRLEN